MSKITLDGFSEIIANIQKLKAEFEAMGTSIKNAGNAVKNAAAASGGSSGHGGGPMFPVNKGKGVYQPTSNGNVLTFPNSSIDTDAIKQQIVENTQQHQEVTKAAKSKSFGGFNLQSMLDGRVDPSIKIARASQTLQSYKSENYTNLAEKLNNSKQVEAQLLGRSVQASTSRIEDLKSKFSAAKDGLSDKTGKELEMAIKQLAKVSDKLSAEQGRLADVTKQASSMGFGGGSGGQPPGFFGRVKEQFQGPGGIIRGLGLAGSAFQMASTGFGINAQDYRNQSSLISDLSSQRGQIAGIYNQRIQAQSDLTNPENLIKYYGNIAFGKSFEGGTKDSLFKYLGTNGRQRSFADARKQSGLNQKAEDNDFFSSLAGLGVKTLGGAAAGAAGFGLTGLLGGPVAGLAASVVGAGVGGIGALASGIPDLLNSKYLERKGGLRGITGFGDQDIANGIKQRYTQQAFIKEQMSAMQMQEDSLKTAQPLILGTSEIMKGIQAQRSAVAGLGGRAVSGMEGFGANMANLNQLEMGASEFAGARNSLSMTKFRGQASIGETTRAIKMSRGGLGTFDQLAGNLTQLQGVSNSSSMDSLKKVFAEAFASGFKNSGMVQQFAATAMSLTSSLGVSQVGGISRALSGGSRMFQGMGDNASIAMQNAAQGMQAGNAYSTMQGGMTGHMRAYGLMMSGGSSSNSQAMFNRNQEQLNQMQDELTGKASMGSETRLALGSLRAGGMSEAEAKASLLKQISGASAGTLGVLKGALGKRKLNMDDMIKRFSGASKTERENILGSVSDEGANIAGLGSKGAMYLFRNALGNTGASTKAVDEQIAAGNETFRDPLNRRRQEYVNSQTNGEAAKKLLGNPDEAEYRNFLEINNKKGIITNVGGKIRELTADLMSTKEGKDALKNITRRDMAAATKTDMTEGVAPTAVTITALSGDAIRHFAMAMKLDAVDPASPKVDK